MSKKEQLKAARFSDYTGEEIGKDSLRLLSELTERYTKHAKSIAELTEKLESEQEKLKEISRVSIPSLLEEFNLSEIKLSNGTKVLIKEQLKASIAAENFPLAFDNLVEFFMSSQKMSKKEAHGMCLSFVTEELKILDKGVKRDALLRYVNEQGIEHVLKQGIHNQTLGKLCRDIQSSGAQVPEGITTFTYKETTLKK